MNLPELSWQWCIIICAVIAAAIPISIAFFTMVKHLMDGTNAMMCSFLDKAMHSDGLMAGSWCILITLIVGSFIMSWHVLKATTGY